MECNDYDDAIANEYAQKTTEMFTCKKISIAGAYYAFATSVYDGDTFNCTLVARRLYTNNNDTTHLIETCPDIRPTCSCDHLVTFPVNVTIRLKGVDACEMRLSSTTPDKEQKKMIAINSREHLRHLLFEDIETGSIGTKDIDFCDEVKVKCKNRTKNQKIDQTPEYPRLLLVEIGNVALGDLGQDKYGGRWIGTVFARTAVKTDDNDDDDDLSHSPVISYYWLDVAAWLLANSEGCLPYDGGKKSDRTA